MFDFSVSDVADLVRSIFYLLRIAKELGLIKAGSVKNRLPKPRD